MNVHDSLLKEPTINVFPIQLTRRRVPEALFGFFSGSRLVSSRTETCERVSFSLKTHSNDGVKHRSI